MFKAFFISIFFQHCSAQGTCKIIILVHLVLLIDSKPDEFSGSISCTSQMSRDGHTPTSLLPAQYNQSSEDHVEAEERSQS